MRKKNTKTISIIKALLLSIVFLITIVPSVSSKTIQLHKAIDEILICPLVEYLEDGNGTLTIDDFKSKKYDNHWISTDKEVLGFGFTASAYWIRFNIQNKYDIDIEYFLEQSFPTIDDLKLYIFNDGKLKIIETGDKKPFSRRSYRYRTFVFPLKAEAKSTTSFYMRYVTDESMLIKLKVWSPEAFREMETVEYRLLSMFYGILLIMILYNLVIYIFIHRIEYLYYVLFIISYLLLMMVLDGTAFQFLWPDSPVWTNYSIPLFNFLVQIFLGLFCIELVELRTKREGIPYRQLLFKITCIVLTTPVIIIIALAVSSFRHPTAVAVSWTGVVIGFVIAAGIILIVKERNRASIIGLCAGSAIMLGALAIILASFGIIPAMFVTQWSMYIGSVIMVALFSYALADRINTMTKVVIEAERKYRELVESSDDIIFSLDENLTFLSVNRAIRKHLGYYESNVVGKNFLDFIYNSGDVSKHISRGVIEGYTELLMETGKEVVFRTDFKKRHTQEPIELSVKLEYAESLDRGEKILGKASLLIDDTILKYIKMEKKSIAAENYLNNAEILSQRLTQKLYRFVDKTEMSGIRLSLREVLINAIEHGNLDITFEEKTNAMAKDNYLKYVLDRQRDPRYRGRKIHVDYHLTEESVTYTIADEGNGFDYQNLLTLISQKSQDAILPHGRGLIIVQNMFDKVVFNEKGNQVTLVKYFNK